MPNGNLNCPFVELGANSTLVHECDTLQGDSGSPLFIEDGERYRIIGVMESKGTVLGFDLDDTVYIPAASAMSLFNRDTLFQIDVMYEEGTPVDAVIKGIRNIIEARHGREDITITTQQQMLDVLGSVLDVLTFAVGAIAALVHDVLIVLGLFSILDGIMPFSLELDQSFIAAILTVVGYSINDTVVIFDRLRENLIKYKQRDLRDVMNLSANETLSRTLMTSGTTLLALLALLILGGDVIRGFVFAIFWGIIVGTYSSIYVASSSVLMLGVSKADLMPVQKEGVVDDRP